MDALLDFPRGNAPASGTPARRSRLDVAMAHLVRLALDEGWPAPAAASHLVEAVGGDRTVLRQARARILRGAAERSTPFAARAIATLDLALEGEAAVP